MRNPLALDVLGRCVAILAGLVLSLPLSARARAESGQVHQLSGDDVHLYAELLRTADQRVLDSVLIARAFASPSSVIHQAAVRTLAQLAPTHKAVATPWLRTIAAGSDEHAAATAAFGLGLVRDTMALALLERLVTAHRVAAPSAAWALGEIGAPARSRIVDLLATMHPTRRDRPDSARVALLLAAAKLHKLGFTAVAPFLNSGDAATRWAAAYAVARQRIPAGARALMYAPHPDAAFRSEVARELIAPIVGDSLAAPALTRLRELAGDRDPHVRVSAIRSLGTYGPRSRVLLVAAMRDPDAHVRISAAQSVAKAFASDSLAWHNAWLADTGYKFHRSLIESAAAAGVVLAADSLWRGSPDWRLRAAAIGAWSASPDTARARSVALSSVRDPDGRVRASAYDVLAVSDTGRRDPAVQAALRRALSDPDPVSREALPGYKPVARDSTPRPIGWYEDVVRRVVLPSLRGRPAQVTIVTSRGRIGLVVLGDAAPLTVFNYLTLAQRRFYDGATFHRVVPAFVAQDGDPRGDGNGGPGYSIRDELNLRDYSRGAVGMALSGPDTGGSQYFLTLTPQPHLDGHYTLFADVTSGFAAMDALVDGDIIKSVQVKW